MTYKATISFALDGKRAIKQGQLLQDADFKNEAEKNDLLESDYIIEYDGQIEITENGVYDVKDYDTADVNVSSGGTQVIVFDSSKIINEAYPYFYNGITEIKNINTTGFISGRNMFAYYKNLTTVPLLDTSEMTNISYMFNGCEKLKNIPQFNIPKVTNLYGFLNGCSSLSDESLNNVLKTCISATI